MPLQKGTTGGCSMKIL